MGGKGGMDRKHRHQPVRRPPQVFLKQRYLPEPGVNQNQEGNESLEFSMQKFGRNLNLQCIRKVIREVSHKSLISVARAQNSIAREQLRSRGTESRHIENQLNGGNKTRKIMNYRFTVLP